MKGVLLRQLQATGAASPGLVNRLLSSASPPANDGGMIRGMATAADIMSGPSSTSKEKVAATKERSAALTASAEPESTAKVSVMPVASSWTKWWRPDPVTGHWVPEGHEGQVTTSTDVVKSPSRVTRIRSDTTASLEDKRWWTSMEELPDMDRNVESSSSPPHVHPCKS